MTDTDWLQLTDPIERTIARGPAMYVYPACGPRELLVREEMHRLGAGDFPGSHEMIFTTEDDSGNETWEPASKPDFVDGGEHWRKLMSWPRVPTIEEATAFKRNALASLYAKWFDRVAAARAADDDERPIKEPDKPKRR